MYNKTKTKPKTKKQKTCCDIPLSNKLILLNTIFYIEKSMILVKNCGNIFIKGNSN